MTKFEKGDHVGTVHHYGAGLEKKNFGVVTSVGARGVRIRLEKDGEEVWVPVKDVLFRDGKNLVRARPVPAAPPAAAPPAAAPPAAAPPAAAPPAPVSTAPRVVSSLLPARQESDASASQSLTHREVLKHMEGSGVDLLQFWRSIGESLRERQLSAVAEANAAVKVAEQEVADAECLLAEARARLSDALKTSATAESALREVISQTGGVR